MSQIHNFTTMANNYATDCMRTAQNIAPANREYAHRRYAWGYMMDWKHATTVATVAFLALGVLASLKVALVLGLVSLLMNRSVEKHIHAFGLDQGDRAVVPLHYFDPNNEQRVETLRRYMGIPVPAEPAVEVPEANPPAARARAEAWVPDAYALFDVTFAMNKVPATTPFVQGGAVEVNLEAPDQNGVDNAVAGAVNLIQQVGQNMAVHAPA